MSSADASLARELNNFYACFEAIGSQKAKTAEAEVNRCVGAHFTPINFSEHDVRGALKRVNTKNTAGTDYQWAVPQIISWPTTIGLDYNIQPVPCSVCYTQMLQEVHNHSCPRKQDQPA